MKITKEQFLKECYEKYKDKYNFSNMTYINMNTKIKIKCNTCNIFFYKTPKHFLRRGQGCKKCKVIIRDNTKNLIRFIKKSKEIHGDKYSYNHIKKYSWKEIKIFCNRCQMFFYQRPSSHLSGTNHIICCLRKLEKKFIEECKIIHNNKYLYDKVKYIKNNISIKIFCKIHKYYFDQKPAHHIKGHGCSKCKSSRGEQIIINYLELKNIYYIYQKYHCFLNKRLYYDFYIPSKNLYIEYDGRQHFLDIDYFNNNLQENIFNDKIKNCYICHINSNLLRIPYKDKKNIINILDKYLNIKLESNIYYSTKKIYDDLILRHNL